DLTARLALLEVVFKILCMRGGRPTLCEPAQLLHFWAAKRLSHDPVLLMPARAPRPSEPGRRTLSLEQVIPWRLPASRTIAGWRSTGSSPGRMLLAFGTFGQRPRHPAYLTQTAISLRTASFLQGR